MNTCFWSGKKVLVTGHTGFKGSWVSLLLKLLGANVIGYSLPPPTTPSLFGLANLADTMTSYIEDIQNFDALYHVITKEKPEIIFHFAAQSLVRYSYDFPLETYATNIMGTVNLLEALRRFECARVAIIVTSDKCYENQEWVWGYRENDPMGGRDPYSSSKGCAELVTAAYRNSFFTSAHAPLVASVRAGNVIGGGDWALDRLVPDYIRAALEKRAIKIRNPSAIRPWQHVLEPLSGYLLLAEKLWLHGKEYASSWNFGPLDADIKTVGWVINYLNSLWGESTDVVMDTMLHPHEAQMLKLDLSKTTSKLQWQPRWNLEKTLHSIIDWYKAYQNNSDMKDFTLKQIEDYQVSSNSFETVQLAATIKDEKLVSTN